MFNLSSTIDRKNRRVLAAFVAALVALALLVVAPGSVPDADADTNHTFEYVLVFQNGQTLTSPPGGTTDGDQNSVWVPNSGGTDPDNPGAGMLVHMSCSDNFNLDLDPGDASYGYSDAGFEPSNPEDSAWRVADYAFRRVGTNGGQCGNQDLFDHPTLTLVKTVEGGPLSDSDFPAFIDGDAADWGVAYTLNPGDYTASETTQDNYTAGDWGGDCATDGTVTLGQGQHLTCTITNTYVAPPAYLTLVKTVVGGSLTAGDFPAFIDDNEVDWETQYELEPGDYTASETTQDNYTAGDWGGDCATDGTVTIEAGDDLTCTVTNTYVPTPNPSINIEKATNGEDADTPTGPVISVGDTVTWTYVVTNTGDVDLTNVNVSDDQGVTPVLKSGDVGNDGILSVNEIWIYEATGLAVLGQYENLGSVTADHGQDEVSDDDPSHYFGQQVLASATLGDTVWYDCATDDSDDPGCNNGVQDAGEPVIEGAKVTLTGLDGQDVDPDTGGVQTTLTQLTNASGKYLFSGLPEGNYKVQVNINDVPDPSGLDRSLGFTTPSSFTLFLPDAGEDLTSDFGVIADTLPETGTSADVLVPIAAMLLLAGTFAVLASRRWEDGAVTDSRS
jgi:uncharacterized repeat protein (TIGR01451 family)/LPXTG-motif cell wall-anchored protein